MNGNCEKLSKITLNEAYPTFFFLLKKVLGNIKLNEDVEKKTTDFNSFNDFYKSIKNEELFKLFLKKKIKLFSSKEEDTNLVSMSMFGDDLPLKFLFNNQEPELKEQLWNIMFIMFHCVETDEEKKVLLSEQIDLDSFEEVSKKIDENFIDNFKNKFENMGINNETNNLMSDLMDSFKGNMQGNPMENIMNISKNLTSKYQKDMEDGNIEIDKIMGNLGSLMPNMGDMMNSFNMPGGNKQEAEKPVIIDDAFSTANVEVGADLKKKNDGLNLGNIGKMVNQFMPANNNSNNTNSGENNNSNNSNDSNDGGNLFGQLGGLFNLVGDLGNIDSEEKAKEVKSKMDNFLEKEMGFNMEDFNKSINDIQKDLSNKKDD
jgi:hypothetical protein